MSDVNPAGGAAHRAPRERRVHPAMVALLGLVAAGLVAAIVVLVGRGGDGDSRPAAATLDHPSDLTGYLAATGPAVVAVSTYDYRDLSGALAGGLQVTGGAYRQAYRSALTGSGARQTIENKVVQSLDLRQVGVGAITDGGDQATVLVFGVQRVQTSAGDTTRAITLTATVERSGNRYTITGLVEDANAGLPPGSSGLRQAAEAGRSEIVNLLSYRRDHFAADAQRALDGATGTLRRQLAARSASIRTGLQKGRYDLDGAVIAVAVRSVTPSAVTLLVAAQGQRVDADGSQRTVTDGRYAVQVVRTDDGWLVGQITGYGS